MMYLSSIICAGDIEDLNHKSADKLVTPVKASDNEKTPLLKKAKKPETDTISVRLLHAASQVELKDQCREMMTDSSCSWDLCNLILEPGVKYNLEIWCGTERRKVITIPTPGIGEHACTIAVFQVVKYE